METFETDQNIRSVISNSLCVFVCVSLISNSDPISASLTQHGLITKHYMERISAHVWVRRGHDHTGQQVDFKYELLMNLFSRSNANDDIK